MVVKWCSRLVRGVELSVKFLPVSSLAGTVVWSCFRREAEGAAARPRAEPGGRSHCNPGLEASGRRAESPATSSSPFPTAVRRGRDDEPRCNAGRCGRWHDAGRCLDHAQFPSVEGEHPAAGRSAGEGRAASGCVVRAQERRQTRNRRGGWRTCEGGKLRANRNKTLPISRRWRSMPEHETGPSRHTVLCAPRGQPVVAARYGRNSEGTRYAMRDRSSRSGGRDGQARFAEGTSRLPAPASEIQSNKKGHGGAI